MQCRDAKTPRGYHGDLSLTLLGFSGRLEESAKPAKGDLIMTITLDLAPDVEQGLLVQARAKGVSIADFVDYFKSSGARRNVHTDHLFAAS